MSTKVLKLVRKPKGEAADRVDASKEKKAQGETARSGPQSMAQPVVPRLTEDRKAAQPTSATSSPRPVAVSNSAAAAQPARAPESRPRQRQPD